MPEASSHFCPHTCISLCLCCHNWRSDTFLWFFFAASSLYCPLSLWIARKHGCSPTRPQEHLHFSFSLSTLYFPHFLYAVNKAADVHLCGFIGSIFKDLRISPLSWAMDGLNFPWCVCVRPLVCTGLCIYLSCEVFCFAHAQRAINA